MTDHPGSSFHPTEVVRAAGSHPFASLSNLGAQESVERLVELYNLGRKIWNDALDQDVFESILFAIKRLFTAERAFIAVLDQGRLLARASWNIALGGGGQKWPVSSTMLNRVLEKGESILTVDAQNESAYDGIASVGAFGLRSVMCCPLGAVGKPTGVLWVDNRADRGAFTEADLAFLLALSHYASLAVESARRRAHEAEQRGIAEARLDEARKRLRTSPELIIESAPMMNLYARVLQVAISDAPVLLVGETGTGKEIFARQLHEHSRRPQKDYYPIQIGAMSPELIESELFGHEQGAFTTAMRAHRGVFELANGGTLFLDEIADIPMHIQSKLLRVLEQKELRRVGGEKLVKTDFRLISACNTSLARLVAEGRFREDLYYRLNAVKIEIPPLRQHPADIAPLARHFLRRCAPQKQFDDEVLSCMERYSWPGNVRQLRNEVEGSAARSDGAIIRLSDIPSLLFEETVGCTDKRGFEPLPSLINRIEKTHIVRALELTEGNDTEAIRLLGISRAKFYERKRTFAL